MGWHILANIFTIFLTLFRLNFRSDREKDLEILILRQQLNILQRKHNQIVRPERVDRVILSVLTVRLKHIGGQTISRLRNIIQIFQPETIFRWHRELVQMKWAYQHKNKGGRPFIDQELENLILRLAKENPRWGYSKIEGGATQIGLQDILLNDPKYTEKTQYPARFGSRW